jgi:hypothetical protein
LAGGYGRVATTAQIKAVLLSNRYVDFWRLPAVGRLSEEVDTNGLGVYQTGLKPGNCLLAKLTDR